MSDQSDAERLQATIDDQRKVIGALQRENAQLTAQLDVYAAQTRKLIDMADRLRVQSTEALERQMSHMRQIEACMAEMGDLAAGICVLVDAPDPVRIRSSADREQVRRILRSALPHLLALIDTSQAQEAATARE